MNVQLLPDSRIKFSLVALLETGGGSPRNGVVEATVALKDGTALYEDGECRISMKFAGNKVIVREKNVEDCGFGAFVTAQGTYIRKSRKPRFDPIASVNTTGFRPGGVTDHLSRTAPQHAFHHLSWRCKLKAV